jgi:hypothetical protein
MPNQGPPPPNEDILTSLLRHQQEATTSRSTHRRIKRESEIGDGAAESETIIQETPHGPHVRHGYATARFGCGCLKPEGEMAATCQHLINRRERCDRIICKDCAREKVCYECGIKMCEDHWVKVPNRNGNSFYFCARCASKKKGRNFLKSFFEFILAPFIVRERIR